MDFSNSKKLGFLASLRIAMEDHKMTWPDKVKATKQITGYDPAKDTINAKLPQDVVSCFAMAAFGIRRYWSGFDDEDQSGTPRPDEVVMAEDGTLRTNREQPNYERDRYQGRSRR